MKCFRTRKLATTAVILGGIALGVVAAPTAAHATPDPAKPASAQVDALVQPSVVYETITWRGFVYDTYNHKIMNNKQPVSVKMRCTGFVVNPDGWIATAGHCVDPEEGRTAVKERAAEIALSSGYYQSTDLTAADVVGDYEVYAVAGEETTANTVDRVVDVTWGSPVSGVEVEQSLPARVLKFQKYDSGDGALMKVDAHDLNAIPLAVGTTDVGTDITTVGYPAIVDSFTDADLQPTFNLGQVSSTKSLAGGLVTILQLSAGLSGGMSGGPTVDSNGDVVGVNSSGFDGEAINYAMPIDRIRELMASQGVDNVLSDTTQAYRDGIKAYAAGDRLTATRLLKSVVTDQPRNGLAVDYLAKAEQLPMPTFAGEVRAPGHSGFLALAAGGVAGLMVLAGVLVLVVVHRARRRSSRTGSTFGSAMPTPAPSAPQPTWTPAPTQATMADAATAATNPADTMPLVPSMSVVHPVGPDTARPDATTAPRVGFAPAAVSQSGSVMTATAPFCTGCGTRTVEAASFCPTCGHRVDQ